MVYRQGSRPTRASSDHNTRGHEYKLFPSCRPNRIDVRKYFLPNELLGLGTNYLLYLNISAAYSILNNL